MERWHVIRSKPAQEHKAEQALLSLGYSTLYPQVFLRSLHRVVPMFQGYLMVQFDGSSAYSWQEVRHASGVAYILGGANPFPLAPTDVVRIRGAMPDGLPVRYFEEADSAPLELGQAVRINDGFLYGQVGTVIAAHGSSVILNVASLGRVSLPRTMIDVPEPDLVEILQDQAATRDTWLRDRLRRVIRGESSATHDRRLGCSLDELAKYFEGKFSKGMSWNNWGVSWVVTYVRWPAMYEHHWEADHHSNLVPIAFHDFQTKLVQDAALMEFSRGQRS